MLYNVVKDKLKKNKELKESGGYVGIPIPHKRLSEYFPSLERGHSIGILGATGTGKSRYARSLSLYIPYKFYKETGYKTKIFYLPLEDSKEKVYMNIMCNYLFIEHNIKISLQQLQSKGDKALPQFVLDAIEEGEEYFKEFEQVVTIIDGYSKPKEIFEVLEKYLLKMGTVTEYEVDIEGNKEKQYRYDSDIHVVVLVDNYSNIDLDDGHASERQAVLEFAKDYGRKKLCNFYQCTLVQVLQADFATERQQFGSDGKAIMSKVEPNLASIGDVKTVARSLHVVLGLFDPSRYEFLSYPSIPPKTDNAENKVYKIDILGNKFRALRVLKNNDGDVGMRVGLLFDALSETWTELPTPDSDEMQRLYDQFKTKGLTAPVKIKNTVQQSMDYDEDAPF